MVNLYNQQKIDSLFLKTIKPFCSDEATIIEMFEAILKAYNSSNRFYHNIIHIEKMLAQLPNFGAEITDFNCLVLAIIYHDVVYEPKKQDNEEKSAIFAKKQLSLLNFPIEKAEKVERMIISTKKHYPLDDNFDSKLFLDLDLMILAADFFEYKNYSSQIRKEYDFVPKFLFRQKRKEVLLKFLQRDRIYFTSFFYKNFESIARQNIQNEIVSSF